MKKVLITLSFVSVLSMTLSDYSFARRRGSSRSDNSSTRSRSSMPAPVIIDETAQETPKTQQENVYTQTPNVSGNTSTASDPLSGFTIQKNNTARSATTTSSSGFTQTATPTQAALPTLVNPAPASENSAADFASQVAATTAAANENIIEENVLVSDRKSEEYKYFQQCLSTVCSAGDTAPRYFSCFNKYKKESSIAECSEELNENQVDIESFISMIEGDITAQQKSVCSSIGGQWTGKTCSYTVEYRREGDLATKNFEIGKTLYCSYLTFGLKERREELDTSEVDMQSKIALITSGLQLGMTAVESGVFDKKEDGKGLFGKKGSKNQNSGEKKGFFGIGKKKNQAVSGTEEQTTGVAVRSNTVTPPGKIETMGTSYVKPSNNYDSSKQLQDWTQPVQTTAAERIELARLNANKDLYEKEMEFQKQQSIQQGLTAGASGLASGIVGMSAAKKAAKNGDIITGACFINGAPVSSEGMSYRVQWIY